VAVVHLVELLAGDRPDHGAAADAAGAEAGLLPGHPDHLDRPPRLVLGAPQPSDRFDGPEDADHAVVAAGIQGRVEMRPGQHPRLVGGGARPATEEIAYRIEADLEPGVAHQLGDVFAGDVVLGRVDLAGEPAAVVRGVDRGKLLDPMVEAVDFKSHGRRCTHTG
jgi:hypothetical protein